MFSFFSKTPKAFGLDVSGSSLKIMQLENQKSSSKVKSYAEVPFPKGLIANDTITDVKTFNFLVKQALEKPQFGRLDTNYAVASLPEAKSFVRVIQIPKMSDAEAENAVPFEAESFIPLPIDQVYLDWQKLGETADKMNILIIASPKEFVDSYLHILDGTGIKTLALEVESQSCLRALLGKDNKDTVLVVDLDAFRSSLIMVEEGAMQFTSTIPVAGNTFTEAIAKSLGVAGAKAEEIKKKVGISNTVEYPNVKTALLPVLSNLSEEIKNILKFHSQHSERQVSKIILAGGTSRLTNLAEFLEPLFTDFGSPKVVLGDPWLNLPQIKNSPLNALDSLGFVTAIGLAMRGSGQV